MPVCLLMSFAAVLVDRDVSWMTSIAHRTWDLPNPYNLPFLPSTEGLLAPEPLSMPDRARLTRYFVIEDSADMMGLPLTGNVLLGFQVEFVGPGEEPTAAHKTTRVTVDPYHPRYLMPTWGVRISF
jgi:hypothetical protein